MDWNTGILLSHNPSAEPGHSFTSVSLLPRQHLGWVWGWVDSQTCTHKHGTTCYVKETHYAHACARAHTLSILKALKQMHLCMPLRHRQRCLHVESTQSSLCHLSHLHSLKPIFHSLPSFTINALSFICSEKRTD